MWSNLPRDVKIKWLKESVCKTIANCMYFKIALKDVNSINMQYIVHHLCQNLPFKFTSYYFVELLALGLDMTVTFATTPRLLLIYLQTRNTY